MAMDFRSDFDLFDKVMIDDDRSLIGKVTSFQFRPISDGGCSRTVEVSYIHNGSSHSAWVETARLKVVT
jgi:hypothetical protein